jgi:hypothetical protein
MKSILALFLAMFLFTAGFGQRRSYENRHRGSYDDYMSKSIRLKTTGWVLLGAGVGMIAGGVVLIASDSHTNDPNYDGTLTTQQTIGAVLVTAGIISSLGSIPLLVIGGVMHKKAMRANAFLNMEKVPGVKITGIPLQSFPAIGLKINL